MNWFIKKEVFLEKISFLSKEQKDLHIEAHKNWVLNIRSSGRRIKSGFLVDSDRKPGGGGLLIFEAKSYSDALQLIKEDPMIKSKLVDWELHEWITITLD